MLAPLFKPAASFHIPSKLLPAHLLITTICYFRSFFFLFYKTFDLSSFLLCAGSISFHFLGRRSTTAILSAIMPEAKKRKRNATNTEGRPLKKRNGVTAGIARPADADSIPSYGRDDSQVRNAQSSPPPHNCVQQQMSLPPTQVPNSALWV